LEYFFEREPERERERERHSLSPCRRGCPPFWSRTRTEEEAHPDRFYDVGIAEENAVTMGTGMAAEGVRPFIAI